MGKVSTLNSSKDPWFVDQLVNVMEKSVDNGIGGIGGRGGI